MWESNFSHQTPLESPYKVGSILWRWLLNLAAKSLELLIAETLSLTIRRNRHCGRNRGITTKWLLRDIFIMIFEIDLKWQVPTTIKLYSFAVRLPVGHFWRLFLTSAARKSRFTEVFTCGVGDSWRNESRVDWSMSRRPIFEKSLPKLSIAIVSSFSAEWARVENEFSRQQLSSWSDLRESWTIWRWWNQWMNLWAFISRRRSKYVRIKLVFSAIKNDKNLSCCGRNKPFKGRNEFI